MVIFSYSTVRDFFNKYPESEESLMTWFDVTEAMSFANFHEVKKSFNSVDAIGNSLYVFNIHGNKYRLIARIHFRVRTVYIRFIGTHQQYDKVEICLL